MSSVDFRSAVVIKLGGSLYDCPGLGPRLLRWLLTLSTRQVLFVPGGGPTADAIRRFDRDHSIGDEAAHWLALRALTLNAHFVAHLLTGVVVDGWSACRTVWREARIPVLDGFRFAESDEGCTGALPHCWDVTSDAVAARAAAVGGAQRLILLKSVTIPDGIDWSEAGRRGLVDRSFAGALARECVVQSINFRSWQP
jgi:aspartokinase-like uncharacterized kinase